MAFNKNFKGGARDYGRPRDDRGPKRFGDKPRGGFGGPKHFGAGQSDRGPVEMFSATCANCNKACEVPFRPSGDRPVYCKDCFGTMKGADEPKRFGGRDDRAPRGDLQQFGDRSPRPSFTAPRPGGDASAQKIEELSKKVDALAVSLDYAIKLFKGDAPVKKVEVAAEKKELAAEKKVAKPLPVAPSKETRLAKKAAPKKAVKGKGKKA